MRTTDYFLLVVIAILVVLSGIFSMSDMVYGVVNQLRLKKDVEKGSKRAKIALDFASNYDTTISTILPWLTGTIICAVFLILFHDFNLLINYIQKQSFYENVLKNLL